MKEHSKVAWEIASRYSSVLASETRDLAAAIDEAINNATPAPSAAAGETVHHINGPFASPVKTDRCIDCDGKGIYPSGETCLSCGGCGRVEAGDGEPDPTSPEPGTVREALAEDCRKCASHGPEKMSVYRPNELLKRAAAALSKPAEVQAERDFCTFGPPDERKRQWIMIYQDADMGILVFDNEKEAHEKWDRAKDNWTCTLYETCVRKYYWAAGELRALSSSAGKTGEPLDP